MKTTVDVHDALLLRARRRALERGGTLRSLIEEGLRRALDEPASGPYRLPDRSVGDPERPDPLAEYSWPELRRLIHEDRGGPDS